MSLREVLIDELKDLYSAENQLVKSLPKAAKGAESAELKQALTRHLEETKGQVERLKQVFQLLEKKPTGKHCSGMEGAIEEVKEALEEDSEGAVFDSGLVGASLRVEHYEIAGYSAAILMAATLGEKEIVGLLKETLAEEQTAAKTIISLGKVIMKEAYSEEGDEDEPEKKPKNAKEKKSEKDSEKDETDAEEDLAKPSEEIVAAAPAKKAAKKSTK